MKKDNSETSVRLDKWLWAARFYKTRSIAKDMIQSGKVEYNGQKAKTSKIVEIGATIKLKQGFDTLIIVVKKIDEIRKSYSEAKLLYIETEESILKRLDDQNKRRLSIFFSPKPTIKPNKKQRRILLKIKGTY